MGYLRAVKKNMYISKNFTKLELSDNSVDDSDNGFCDQTIDHKAR